MSLLHQQLRKKGFTEKQANAMECLLSVDGSYTKAKRRAKEFGVSGHYIRNLLYQEQFVDWQLEYKRRLYQGMATAEEVDEDFIVEGLIELTYRNVQDSVRLGAYRALAEIKGIGKPKEMILRVEDLKRLQELGTTEDEVLEEVKKILDEQRGD